MTGVTGVDPPASQWEVMTTDGIVGPTGPTGPIGPTGPSAYPIGYVYGELSNLDSPRSISSASTWITAVEIDLTTGTWFVSGNAMVTGSAAFTNQDLRIFGVSTSQTVAASAITLGRATGFTSMTASGFVVIAISSLKIRLQVASSSTTDSILSASGMGLLQGCTNLSAVRLA